MPLVHVDIPLKKSYALFVERMMIVVLSMIFASFLSTGSKGSMEFTLFFLLLGTSFYHLVLQQIVSINYMS